MVDAFWRALDVVAGHKATGATERGTRRPGDYFWVTDGPYLGHCAGVQGQGCKVPGDAQRSHSGGVLAA